jgi:uroporphyrin-III C-methyltransferase/precorrin-2 dehydrogenase/sirohydrochlorin ferrochelatase
MSLFPMFLKLDGRPCLVVGAGAIARPKIESLLRANARVTVVAPEAQPEIEQWAREGRLEWMRSEFAAENLGEAFLVLGEAFLVVAATNLKAVNHAVAEAARARGVLCNSVDDPPDCDFYYPSVVERGDLQVAVSTAGKSPALAQRLREELSSLLPEDIGAWLDAVGEQRLGVLAALQASGERKEILHQLARREICDPRECPVEQKLDKILMRAAAERIEPGAAEAGTVYLTGAGPGAAEMLTIRARALIQTASCILHDDLVPAAMVSLARPDAKVVNVGKRCGQKLVTQEQIQEWMVEYAREGHSVVRLKSGDPTIFGRAAEEIAALTEANISFEIVPGVSASVAAAAAAKASLTERDASSRVVLTTRHRAGNKTGGVSSLDKGSTLALYMPGKDYASLQRELLDGGWPAETACVLVSAASLPAQQIAKVMLSELAGLRPLPAPVVILIFPSSAV